MYKLKNAHQIFWVFIFCIIFLQLSTSKDLSLSVSFIYSLTVVVVLKIYLDFILNRLINWYLEKNSATKFILYSLMISAIVAAVLTIFSYYIFLFLLPNSVFLNFVEDVASTYFGMLAFTILFSGVIFGIEILKQKSEIEKRDQILKNSVLEIEVEHLRTQLSPHFTFNILNNLQFLIRKDKDEALDLLARYSSILRYYVYESKNKWIKLNDEISFLKHYIHLEKGRSGDNLILECTWVIPENKLLIIPFVLSTFVENAFKHVSTSISGENSIHMNVYLQNENTLVFFIKNTFDKDVQKLGKPGVGLENVKKRLELSYPKAYELDINSNDETFQVQLQIKLSKA